MGNVEEIRAGFVRVSDIIAKQNESEIRSIPLEVFMNASIRGTKVDAYCASFLEGFFLPEIENEYKPYCEAFQQWFSSNVRRVVNKTTRLYDEEKRITGKFDFIVELEKEEIALFDLKATATTSKTWPIQLSAYRHLCSINEIKIDKAYNLHLVKRYLKRPADLPEEEPTPFKIVAKCIDQTEHLDHSWEIFLASLRCYDYFNRKEGK